MSQDTDTSNAAVRPPVAWLLALAAGVAADQLYPLRFVPASVPGGWVGGAIFAIAFALAIWAIVTIRKAGTQVETYKPTTTIVANGPYRLTRNPIYLAMVLGLIGLAIAFDSLWIVVTLVPLLSRHPLRRGRPRGSLSRAQVRRRLSQLSVPRAPLAVTTHAPYWIETCLHALLAKAEFARRHWHVRLVPEATSMLPLPGGVPSGLLDIASFPR